MVMTPLCPWLGCHGLPIEQKVEQKKIGKVGQRSMQQSFVSVPRVCQKSGATTNGRF